MWLQTLILLLHRTFSPHEETHENHCNLMRACVSNDRVSSAETAPIICTTSRFIGNLPEAETNRWLGEGVGLISPSEMNQSYISVIVVCRGGARSFVVTSKFPLLKEHDSTILGKSPCPCMIWFRVFGAAAEMWTKFKAKSDRRILE
jgi:hypothetical protein